VTLPETRYARNNGLHVAYQRVGDGPVDIVLLTRWFSNIDSQWDVPPLAAFIRRLARFGRVLTFDKRGTGLSDPVPASELPSIEEWMDDLRTVMDESGIDRAVLVANLASSFMAMTRMINLIDVRSVLPTITVPTMVISRADPAAVPAAHRRYVADHIQGARYVEVAGADELMWAGDQDALVGEVLQFVTGARPVAEPDRVLATILFTDIVGSARLAAEHGDRAWRELLERHHALVRSELARFRGREVDTAGDGFLAVFDGPGRAVRCASAAVRSVHSLGIEIRAGVHTGEVEVVGDGVRGIAVHIGARVSSLASASEVLVSSTVRDLVAGSGLQFEDRGSRELKGVPDPWRVLALIDR
jgi:class 3 adenylate cyclase